MRDTFISACNTLKSLPNEYTIDFESEFSALHMRYKRIVFQLNGDISKRKIVSSCIADSRKRKSHGADNFKNKKNSIVIYNITISLSSVMFLYFSL